MRPVSVLLLTAMLAGGASVGGRPVAAAAGDPVLIAAGDIADCGTTADSATARLLDEMPGTIATLGDNVYESGTAAEFRDCYAPTWGRHLARTRPSPGNHDYKTAGAAGYLGYFGTRARPAGTTWYSYDLGAWHIVVLDSNCAAVGGCGPGSAQLRWLQSDLAVHAGANVLAYWHHPRSSSGAHGSNATVQPFWDVLWTAGADVVLNGHDHDYERFAPQDRYGRADATHGIRQFIVGTGGTDLRARASTAAHSQVFSSTHGVLRLTLGATSYAWSFVPVAGATFTDAGSGGVHEAPPPRTRTTITASSDTYVDQARPTTVFGSASRLWVDADTGDGLDRHAYVRFAVPSLSGVIDRVVLRLWVLDGTRDGPRVYPTSTTWSGRTLTWRNRPGATATALADLGPVAAGAWLDVDVTRAVREGERAAFLLRPTSGNGLAVASLQGSRPPRLRIETVPDE